MSAMQPRGGVGGRQDRGGHLGRANKGTYALVKPLHLWKIRFSLPFFTDARKVPKPKAVRSALN
eukprot:175942-Prorocentrum_minimum.AAC.1